MNRFIIAALVFAVHGNGLCVQISGRNKEKRGLSDIDYGSGDKLSSGGYAIGMSGQLNQGYNADYNPQGYYAAAGSDTDGKFGGFATGYDSKNVLDADATNGLGLNSNNYLALSQSSQPLQYSGQQPSYVPAYRSVSEQGLPSVYSGSLTQSYPGKGELDLPNFQGQIPLALSNSPNIGGGFTSGIKGGFGSGYKSNLSGGGFGGFRGLNSFSGGHNLGSRGFFRGYRSLPESPRESRYVSYGEHPALMKVAYIPSH